MSGLVFVIPFLAAKVIVCGGRTYACATDGSVWRWIPRSTAERRRATKDCRWAKLAPRYATNGYVRYSIREKHKDMSGHRLVWMAWNGAIPDGMEVCHNDGTRDNNAIANLRVDTRSGNFADKLAHGTHIAGEKHYAAKLTEQDVAYIRKAAETGRALARRFSVSTALISVVKNNKRWTHCEVSQ